MKLTRILSVCVTVFLAAISALGQGDKSTVTVTGVSNAKERNGPAI